MGTGTANLRSTSAIGDVITPEMANDLATLAAHSDDEALFDLYDLEPPAAATATNVNVGYIPLEGGGVVQPHATGRSVDVMPVRVARSSTSNATPRAMLSAVSGALTTVAMPAAPSATNWGLELLYAQLSLVTPTDPSKGAQVTFLWAPSPAYVASSLAGNAAALPANTSTTWNVPLMYVRNYYGQTSVAAHDLISVGPLAALSPDGKMRRRVGAAAGTIHARRGYASALQSVATLLAANAISTTVTPSKAHREDLETVFRVFKIDASLTVGTSGSTFYFDLDDTRDWRKGDFVSFWLVPGTTVPTFLFGEEDAASGTSATRQLPTSTAETSPSANANAHYLQFGQSFEPWQGSGSYARVGAAFGTGSTDQGAVPLLGAPYYSAPSNIAVVVDMSTGKLRLAVNIAGSGNGSPVTIFMFATFGNTSR